MHVCTVCSQECVHPDHPEICDWGPSGIHFHNPPLCCLGCACRSVEEAHPEEDSSVEMEAA